ncbi:2-oxoglutarate (2OG) and Fe(II)-dependent oxygenase superfamily protein [Tasmannia lanceolata]|uniref:2-oxoglutarate (2OG) and Fe(II)-dependent oxygenase superfamily protein n=1 Tax=Tasmannia lanceolata TaxID=3420 RepID=UPI0040642706
MNNQNPNSSDPFIRNFKASELQIAAEFLTDWLPFLTRDLCPDCKQILQDRVHSIDPGVLETNGDVEQLPEPSESFRDSSCNPPESPSSHDNCENCDTNSLGSWKDGANEWSETSVDRTLLGSWKDGANEWSETSVGSIGIGCGPEADSPMVRMSWADMAQEEDELEEEEGDANGRWGEECSTTVDEERKVQQKPTLSRDQREYIRFMNVQRRKDFICFERVKGKFVNILDGLELHTGVFSAAEQKRIVDLVYVLQERGRKGQLKERTYSEPRKWMPGKGRVTIQFGCCYNYAMDKDGNPPGILRNEVVDPIPPLFKVIIRRLVGWHVIPPSCVPDSCIVNIYEEGDCIPPHIDNHDFIRPFCTVSFLSECDILFGSNLKIAGPGEFSGSSPISLPLGSVLVLNGNGADIAKHCVPAVPTKRISITFRKMDDIKRPFGFALEPDLQGIQPLPYGLEKPKKPRQSKPHVNATRRVVLRGNQEREHESNGKNRFSEQNLTIRTQLGAVNSRRVRVNIRDL